MQENTLGSDERVILVGCQLEEPDHKFAYSMDELVHLVRSAKGTVVATLTQKRKKIEPSTYIGKGKIEELVHLIEEKEADTIIFNDELTTSQVRNIHERTKAAVIDRTQLILDIFSQRAQSREGKLQVELAQLSYLLPRLGGQGLVLSRQGGGIGTRGPGETQLETDRRHIRRRMDEIKRQLEAVVSHRKRYRERRKHNEAIQIALVGYTNAGKSTLLNRLVHSETLAEDQLFATLDPTTRQLHLPSGMSVLLSDTVGFIQDLPTTLIAAFRSTLEELIHADLLLHVVDCSNPDYEQHEKTVKTLMTELDAAHIPQLLIYNKADEKIAHFFPTHEETSIEMSALNPKHITALKKAIESKLIEQFVSYELFLRPDEGRLLAQCKHETILREQTWLEEKELYYVSGFVKELSTLGQQLRLRMEEKEGNK